MKDALGSTASVGDKVLFIPKPTRDADFLMQGIVTAINAKTVKIEAEWYDSKWSNKKSVMQFNRLPEQFVLLRNTSGKFGYSIDIISACVNMNPTGKGFELSDNSMQFK